MTDQPALAMQPLAQMPMCKYARSLCDGFLHSISLHFFNILARSLKSQSGSSTADDQPDAQAAMRLRGGCGCEPTLVFSSLCNRAHK